MVMDMKWMVCDHPECEQPPEREYSRFCTKHRQEHGRKLMAQLQAIIDEHDRGR